MIDRALYQRFTLADAVQEPAQTGQTIQPTAQALDLQWDGTKLRRERKKNYRIDSGRHETSPAHNAVAISRELSPDVLPLTDWLPLAATILTRTPKTSSSQIAQ